MELAGRQSTQLPNSQYGSEALEQRNPASQFATQIGPALPLPAIELAIIADLVGLMQIFQQRRQ